MSARVKKNSGWHARILILLTLSWLFWGQTPCWSTEIALSQDIKNLLKQHMQSGIVIAPGWVPESFGLSQLSLSWAKQWSNGNRNATYSIQYSGSNLQNPGEYIQFYVNPLTRNNLEAKIKLQCSSQEKPYILSQPAFRRYPIAVCVQTPAKPGVSRSLYKVRLISYGWWFGANGEVAHLDDFIHFVSSIQEVQ